MAGDEEFLNSPDARNSIINLFLFYPWGSAKGNKR
jgi:hypothetical protein